MYLTYIFLGMGAFAFIAIFLIELWGDVMLDRKEKKEDEEGN